MNGKLAAGLVIGLAFLALLVYAVLPESLTWPVTGPGVTVVGVALWQDRTFEVLLQSMILLGGVVGILLLLGSRRSRGVNP
jgi:NADH:ubiquinone oxidoreductase subunit 6 (subunit J)